MKKEIREVINKGFEEPSSERQKEAIKKAIDLMLKEVDSKTNFLIELKDFLVFYIEEEK